MSKLNVLVAGATGYIGVQLVKLLLKHKKINIKYLCGSSSIGKKISNYDISIKKKLPIISKFTKSKLQDCDIIFTALPNGEAQKIAKHIPDQVKLIDLSADFRLNNHRLYKKWYGIEHKSKKLINKSMYAVTEFSKKHLHKYKIISCPGCYQTSVQIPLIPLVRKKMINTKNIIIDSKSGYSGAGKNIKKKFKFKNLLSSVSAYGVGSHRHMVEIDQELSKVSKDRISVFFTPHLIPMFRGILSTIYLETRGNNNAKKIFKTIKKYHKNNFFVKIARYNTPIGTGEVVNTNYCQISVCESRSLNKVIIICTIDNLIKGGSGQAVQNMNVAFGYDEKLGLK